jgi:hypothetical protein
MAPKFIGNLCRPDKGGLKKNNILDRQFFNAMQSLYLLTSGYLELRGHESMVTTILWLLKVSACRVSILTFGIFFSAGTNI